MSPGDRGERVKAFVFLDHFELDIVDFPELPMHPHSGISTHTTLMQGGLHDEDFTGKSGHLEEGRVEYMQARDDAGSAGAREVAARPRPPRRAAPAAGAGVGGRPDLAGRFAEVA
jgi:Pirin